MLLKTKYKCFCRNFFENYELTSVLEVALIMNFIQNPCTCFIFCYTKISKLSFSITMISIFEIHVEEKKN